MSVLGPYTPLLNGISQYEVDFVIPRLGADIPIGIDPFLLYKSRDPDLKQLHSVLVDTFNYGISLIDQNRLSEAREFFVYPEVSSIGLGYTRKSKRGSGIGRFLTELIIETLLASPALVKRGVKHLEEMQLVSIGIGPDRVSDITANILKRFLIEYTQKQCVLWNIPLTKDVPVQHVFDSDVMGWFDDYFDLPISIYDSTPIILVPRRIVRTLPWINYDDFLRTEFSSYLRAKRVQAKLGTQSKFQTQIKTENKESIVDIVRSEVERIDRYIQAKEESASDAQPSLSYIDAAGICSETEALKQQLSDIQSGTAQAAIYQRKVLEILNFLFNPELIDGEMEVKTIDGTERRDIIFTNDSDQTFWSYLRDEHSGVFLMFEVKNVEQIDNNNINQTAEYLGDRLGRVGFIVTRHPLRDAQERKVFSIYNDSYPRKIILTLSDEDLSLMLDMKCQNKNPMRHIQKLYRSFRTRVQ